MEPLGWDEIVSQPGMGGYLSFLNGPIPLPHLVPPDPGVVSLPRVDKAPGVDSPPAPESAPEAKILETTEDHQTPDPVVPSEVVSAPGVSPIPRGKSVAAP